PPFQDVPIDEWFCPVVNYAVETGVFSSEEMGLENINPSGEVTRSTAAGWLFRSFFQSSGESTSGV
ncbi:MAG: hypothetical protein U1C97_00145, partial [Candidatus Gracilibacteria bacterium]|nr:hypothetical protein [Candidatus Gracilibacteria bacterium]